jgi:endonuclease/exonuclease/phosphatase family metal-dependent hydrolase
MTRNLYLGTDLLPLASAAPGAPFQHAVAAGLASVEATDPTARMALIAKEIAGARPDLVGLQEMSIWTTGPLGSHTAPSHIVVDYLKLITADLKALHAPYRVVAERLSLHLQAPSAAGVEVGFTDGNVILAHSGVAVSHVHSADFTHQLKLATAALGAVTVTRSWNALDATVGGARFHVVNTQLEAYSSSVRLQQAQELAAGPLKSSLQKLLVGDLNSSPNLPLTADRLPYLAVRRAGFTDERTAQVNCCFNDDLRTGRWDHIVDHIMAKPALKLVRSYLTGRETTAAGRHPSDHGGVVSVLQLP